MNRTCLKPELSDFFLKRCVEILKEKGSQKTQAVPYRMKTDRRLLIAAYAILAHFPFIIFRLAAVTAFARAELTAEKGNL
jgi:hypothetical protein